MIGKISNMKEIKFSENLKRARVAANMTQALLAQKLGVDQRTISAWEKGVAQPSFEMLAVICDVFGESFDSILSD